MANAMGALAFGFLFIAATSAGVEALGISVCAAASAFVEKGQNAFALCGRRIAANERPANPTMRNCWLNFIGNSGGRVCLQNTRMAYIHSYISHSLNTSVSVDTSKYSRAELVVNRLHPHLWRAVCALYFDSEVS